MEARGGPRLSGLMKQEPSSPLSNAHEARPLPAQPILLLPSPSQQLLFPKAFSWGLWALLGVLPISFLSPCL